MDDFYQWTERETGELFTNEANGCCFQPRSMKAQNTTWLKKRKSDVLVFVCARFLVPQSAHLESNEKLGL